MGVCGREFPDHAGLFALQVDAFGFGGVVADKEDALSG